MALPVKDPNKDPNAPVAPNVLPAAVPGTVPNAAATITAPNPVVTQASNAPTMLPTQIVHPTLMQKVAAGPQAFGGLPNAPASGSAMANADAAALTRPSNVLGIPTAYAKPSTPALPSTPAIQPQAWNMIPVAAPNGSLRVAYADGAYSAPQLHPAPNNFYRDQSSPQSDGSRGQRPGELLSTVNAPAVGTQIGRSLVDARKASANMQVGALNAGMSAGEGIVNAATYLPRQGLGVARDIGRALAGAPESPNAGQPLGGLTAPQLNTPYPTPTVNFGVTDTPPAPADRVGLKMPFVDFGQTQNLPTRADFTGTKGGVVGSSQRSTSPDNGGATGAPQTKMPGIDSGTTVEPDANGKPRTLQAGAMVNGVPTFSDGTGGIAGSPGSIPRTMSAASIGELAKERSISNAGTGYGVLASDVTGGPVSTDQMVNQRVSQIQQPITGSRPSAQQFAEANAQAIASKDPRSAAGIAARNLSMDAQYGGTSRTRKLAADQLAEFQAGAQQSGMAAQQAEAQAANTATTGQNALDNTALQGQNQINNTLTQLKAPKTRQQNIDADGNVWMTDPVSGASIPVTGGDGKQLKQAVTKDDTTTKRTNELMDGITAQANKLFADYSKNQALVPEKDQKPANIQEFREQAARAGGHPIIYDQKTGAPYANINNQWVPL